MISHRTSISHPSVSLSHYPLSSASTNSAYIHNYIIIPPPQNPSRNPQTFSPAHRNTASQAYARNRTTRDKKRPAQASSGASLPAAHKSRNRWPHNHGLILEVRPSSVPQPGGAPRSPTKRLAGLDVFARVQQRGMMHSVMLCRRRVGDTWVCWRLR